MRNTIEPNYSIRILMVVCFVMTIPSMAYTQNLTEVELRLVRSAERERIATINKVVGSVIAIYGENRQGGGSGVIIDPTGIALTNHHVIVGAGISGWGGLSDGHLYHWTLIGTDPGGDVALIQMEPIRLGDKNSRALSDTEKLKPDWQFPFTPLGDSDLVNVGDWALVMGNPFLLAEDQKPTVTLGIVSGVKRYQAGAGKNQLVYGNCIQVDSSINPGNSGGPLFNMDGQVIGINGRGSFQDRGRVNVGLGYAISSNQIKNFIPDLMATKVVEHGTLDAIFADRNGMVLCESLYDDSPLYRIGVRPGDELMEFEGIKIESANQFTNLICTLPEDWPAHLLLRNSRGETRSINMRLFGLPYMIPRPRGNKQKEKPSPAEQQQQEQMRKLVEFLSSPPGTVRDAIVNKTYANHVMKKFRAGGAASSSSEIPRAVLKIHSSILDADSKEIGTLDCWLDCSDNEFLVHQSMGDDHFKYLFRKGSFYSIKNESESKLEIDEAMRSPPLVMALGVLAANSQSPFSPFGQTQLHGSGKAQNRIAYRMQTTVPNANDHFYFWLSMLDANGRNNVELLKASATMDNIEEQGATIFKDWQTHNRFSIPAKFEVVSGLAETRSLVYVNQVEQVLKKGDGDISNAPSFRNSAPRK